MTGNINKVTKMLGITSMEMSLARELSNIACDDEISACRVLYAYLAGRSLGQGSYEYKLLSALISIFDFRPGLVLETKLSDGLDAEEQICYSELAREGLVGEGVQL